VSTGPSSRSRTPLVALVRLLAAISLLAVGGVHIQQYIVQDYRVIPTIGPLFLLNFIGGTVLGLYFLIPVSTRAGRVRLFVDAVAAWPAGSWPLVLWWRSWSASTRRCSGSWSTATALRSCSRLSPRRWRSSH
jgi:hypothetical protein